MSRARHPPRHPWLVVTPWRAGGGCLPALGPPFKAVAPTNRTLATAPAAMGVFRKIPTPVPRGNIAILDSGPVGRTMTDVGVAASRGVVAVVAGRWFASSCVHSAAASVPVGATGWGMAGVVRAPVPPRLLLVVVWSRPPGWRSSGSGAAVARWLILGPSRSYGGGLPADNPVRCRRIGSSRLPLDCSVRPSHGPSLRSRL